ncbi:MAG: nuclear transport factor 2 family protein [Pseudoxanthomonas sp.]
MNDAYMQAFAIDWIDAWNSHDLERILRHYSEDIAVTSPFVEMIVGPGQGTISGKSALRNYWTAALTKYTDLKFDLFRAYPGVNSVVVHYRSVAGFLGMEFMRFDGHDLVCEVRAHYAPETNESMV